MLTATNHMNKFNIETCCAINIKLSFFFFFVFLSLCRNSAEKIDGLETYNKVVVLFDEI